MTLLPEELEGLDEAAIKALYEEKAAELRVRLFSVGGGFEFGVVAPLGGKLVGAPIATKPYSRAQGEPGAGA